MENQMENLTENTAKKLFWSMWTVHSNAEPKGRFREAFRAIYSNYLFELFPDLFKEENYANQSYLAIYRRF